MLQNQCNFSHIQTLDLLACYITLCHFKWFDKREKNQPSLLCSSFHGIIIMHLAVGMKHLFFILLRWLCILFYKGLNITSAIPIFPLANVYHIALGIRSIKPNSIRLHIEDPFITQMPLIWQLLIEIFALSFEPTWLLDGISRFLHGKFSLI